MAPGRDQRAQRRSQQVGAVGFAGACALPVLLWRDVMRDIWTVTSDGGEELAVLLVGWAPWVLMALGLLCVVPVSIEWLRDRERRFHRRGNGAWAGWGVTLYLLGFALATQVAQIHDLHS